MKKSDIKKLTSIVDDSVTTIYVKTPKNWKCKKKGCTTNFFHKHSTFKLK